MLYSRIYNFISYLNLKQKCLNVLVFKIKYNYETFTDDKFLLVSVDDASGRFTNGFFWGNTYFTGSATECDYIGTDWNPSHHTYSKNHVNDPKVTINTGLSGINIWSKTDSVEVPFQLGFYMLKLSINVSYTPVSIIDMLQIYIYNLRIQISQKYSLF